MRSEASTRRASIDTTLEVRDALALIESTFKLAKTATTRYDDRGWTIERSGDRLLIGTTHPKDVLLEPLPDDYVAFFPETLALEVMVRALPEGGSRVKARLVRRRIGATIGTVLLDVFGFSFGGNTMLHGGELSTALRENRRAAKLRLLRLAIEPLLPHEKPDKSSPFR